MMVFISDMSEVIITMIGVIAESRHLHSFVP